MPRDDKLIERLRSRPVEMSFDDVRRALEAHDWTFHRQKGSHAIFVKPGERSLTISRRGGRAVKRVYLDFICQRLGLDD